MKLSASESFLANAVRRNLELLKRKLFSGTTGDLFAICAVEDKIKNEDMNNQELLRLITFSKFNFKQKQNKFFLQIFLKVQNEKRGNLRQNFKNFNIANYVPMKSYIRHHTTR